MNELLNDIPYGVIVCHEDGSMTYANTAASKLFKCPIGNIEGVNVLSSIDKSFTSKVGELLTKARTEGIVQPTNFAYIKLKNVDDKFYKLVAKVSENDTSNIIVMIYDYTPIKIQQDILSESYNQMNDSLIRNALVLKVISDICNNVLYKDRSNLSEIVTKLAYAFHLQKAAICFRNGTGHVIYTRRKPDNTYETGKMDGDQLKNDCAIWQNEILCIDCKQLIFKVPCNITCCELDKDKCTINVLKLKLNSQKVIGFFEFIEDDNFKLSHAELEVLESLSQLLAYIVDNKEKVLETTNYIKNKFKALTQPILEG